MRVTIERVLVEKKATKRIIYTMPLFIRYK